MSGGKKNDAGKAQLSLIPQIALRHLAKAMEIGAAKYQRYNYCKGMEASRLIDAMLRHATAWNDGEEYDADGQHHLGSVMANCLMILRQQELGTLVDDRYRPEAKQATITPKLQPDRYQVAITCPRGLHYSLWFDTAAAAMSGVQDWKRIWSEDVCDIRKVPH